MFAGTFSLHQRCLEGEYNHRILFFGYDLASGTVHELDESRSPKGSRDGSETIVSVPLGRLFGFPELDSLSQKSAERVSRVSAFQKRCRS